MKATYCVQRLDATHCRLTFTVYFKRTGITDHFGGKVPCLRAGERVDPGDRRPR